MTALLYSELPPPARPAPQEHVAELLGETEDPAGYRPDEGLVDAVNVALILRQPLLVTGEPGTGKTQLARSVAYQLGLPDPLNFETKSTSVARDLFYTFDNVARFRAAQAGKDTEDLGEFISFNALGEAIILANEENAVRHYLPSDYAHPGQRRSVVLIDEIDKAPRDFPNDILNEVERFFFRVPEAGGMLIRADDRFRPVLIMTSNSEKSLPEAFLRRCIFYSIPFPQPDRLEEIVLTRLSGRLATGSPLMSEAIEFFMTLRANSTGLRKKPGTAELLNWLVAMLEFGCEPSAALRSQWQARRALSALAKVAEDQDRVGDEFSRWFASSGHSHHVSA
ncbi:hypothetical protein CI15_07665 [Paraburkholderia monticola]|uniref:AAA+ ATPase domain-containing protein n=1 Tax=Paraburkholderia monticola TaxID=1399968 RepID=A0A149PYA4_9BURK|nr:MoxR family ATPase [Paraburkholderia monticola]KXU90038.1 hypothetical protein CI15_07665 [Paraburkholderia monticola]